MNRPKIWTAAALVLLALLLALLSFRDGKTVSGPLSHEVYIWQRAWTAPVLESISLNASNFAQLTVLAAEVNWRSREPQLYRVPIDYPALKQTARPVALALRISSYPGPFLPDDPQTLWLADLAKSLVTEALTNQVQPVELQIDFDCATAKLDGYRVWVDAFRRAITPVPIAITALPTWLKRTAFKRLLRSCDSYVLQVHSLDPPKNINHISPLCDPAQALHSVNLAARLHKNFRVALPTYGYLIAFAPSGKFIGLSAELPSSTWPANVQVRELRADPTALAGLTKTWTARRPETMQGICWYRLPIATDRLNWRWPTLASVMAGEPPTPQLRVAARRPQPALIEIDLHNSGLAGYTKPVRVSVRWQNARVVAADALQGFETVDSGPNAMSFISNTNFSMLDPGARQNIGWLRLDHDTDVQLELNSE